MTQHGSLQNSMLGNAKSKSPEVGDGVTEVMYTDRFPYTIIEIKDDKHIVVQADQSTRIDDYGVGDCQIYQYHPDPDGKKVELSLRKKGKWIPVGTPTKGAANFIVGTRQRYHDYSF